MIFLLFQWSVHVGAIRKHRDAIQNTQSDAISLKQKLEETKDGVKGAPAPSFKFYKKADFQTKTPMETQSEEADSSEKAARDKIPEFGSPIPEDLSGLKEDEKDWWAETWDEKSSQSTEPQKEESFWQEDW